MEYLKFRDYTETIDSKLLTKLVQKHNVEYVTKPLERRHLWLTLTREYNMEKNTNMNHARLAKRWHNMKQRARKQITDIKRRAIGNRRKAKFRKTTSAEGESDAGKEDDPTVNTKMKQDLLLRQLLICLCRKYKVEDIKGGTSAKNRVWTDLSREFHRVSGGILNASSKQLQGKWTNVKFSFKNKGKPNPYEPQEFEDENDFNVEIIGNKLKPFRKIMDDENLEKEIEAHLQEDYLFASAMHGHKMSLVKSERSDSPPIESHQVPMTRQDYEVEGVGQDLSEPPPRINKTFVESLMDTGANMEPQGNHNRQLRIIEKQIYMETLKYEQERFRLMRDSQELEKKKLVKDIELADIQLQKAKMELERMRNDQYKMIN